MSKQTWGALPVRAILNSVENVLKTGDISRLTKGAYNCLYLMSGFIAHYDHGGFMGHYKDIRGLIRDILNSTDTQDPERYIRDSWFENEYGREYCQSKTDVYKGLREIAMKYQAEIDNRFSLQQSSEEIAYAEALAARNGYKLVKG